MTRKLKSPSSLLQTIPNPHPDSKYEVALVCPEFTCLCPLTGQPDFATLHITYQPGPRCVELKSLKQYLAAYRNLGSFHEDVTNLILKDLVSLLQPTWLEVVAEFRVRGGIETTVRARFPS